MLNKTLFNWVGMSLFKTSISISVANTSVNPARSSGPALLEGGIALSQLWLFWLASIVGAVIGALLYNFVSKDD